MSGGVPTEYTIQNYIVGPLFWLSWTENNTLIRKTSITGGVTANPDPYFIVDVEWDSLPENTFDSLGFHNCYCTYLNIDEKIQNTNIRIYPSPVTNGNFTIEAEEPINKVEIFDITGKLVEIKEFDGRIENVHMDVVNDLKGLYFVKASLKSGQVQTKKLLFN
jgi:hypothetical protein